MVMYTNDKEPWVLFAWHSFIFVVGVPSNILILIVYCAKSRISHNQRMILTLAACDIFGCFSLLPSICFTVSGNYYSEVRCRTTAFLVSSCNLLTIFLAAWVSVDQYRSVRNVAAPVVVTIRKDILILTGLVVFSVLGGGVPLLYLTNTKTTDCKIIDSLSISIYVLLRGTAAIVCTLIVVTYSVKIFQLVRKRRLQIQPLNRSNNQVGRHSEQSQSECEQRYSVQFTNLNELFTASTLQDEMRERQRARTSSDLTTSPSASRSLPAAPTTPGQSQNQARTEASCTNIINTLQSHEADQSVTENRNDPSCTVVVVAQNPRGDMTLSHVTKMLYTVAITTIITRIPSMIVANIWESHISPLKVTHANWYLFFLIIRVLQPVNFATNPFIYSIINKSFREECTNLFRRCYGR